jgi:uncharacterized LabA/DUF88 family protein
MEISMLDSTLVFVDGENLSIRYSEMIRAGRIPSADNIIFEDCFIWNNNILKQHLWNLKRISYYTSCVGDDPKINAVREKISSTIFSVSAEMLSMNVFRNYSGQIIPFVRKKSSKSKKEGICDISIAVDIMRACYRDHAQSIWLFSGDGDFIQLCQEIVHSGKMVVASAFSSGLCPEIPMVVDEFISLDKYFFQD